MMAVNRKLWCITDRVVLWFALPANCVLSVIAFIAMCMDADTLRHSKEWCDGGCSGITWTPAKPPSLTCRYEGYIVVVCLEALIFIVCVRKKL